jgi:hypothetical protein
MRRTFATLLAATALTLGGCDDSSSGDSDTEGHATDGHETETGGHETETGGHETEGEHPDHEEELITTVTLTFTAEGQETVVAAFDDPDGDGGMSGTSDPIILAADTTYTLQVEFSNALEGEEITPEISAEAEDHQILVYGPSVTGPASMGDGTVTHAYADVESDYTDNAVGDDLPVGLSNTITTGPAADQGELRIMLRHLPPLNGAPQKSGDLAAMHAAGESLPGGVDADVGFDLTVQ